MNKDQLIECKRCSSDACFVNEVNENIKTYQCFGCGFQSNSIMKKDEQFFEEQIERLPNLHKELMGEDENGKINLNEEAWSTYLRKLIIKYPSGGHVTSLI